MNNLYVKYIYFSHLSGKGRERHLTQDKDYVFLWLPMQNMFELYLTPEESRKKSSSPNGRAIKRGGVGKGPAIKEKINFLKHFLKFCCHLKKIFYFIKIWICYVKVCR